MRERRRRAGSAERTPHGRPWFTVLFLLVCLSWSGVSSAQDLEPRRWTHLPVGLNVFGLSYAYTFGNIAFDPVLDLVDTQVAMHSVVAAYVRSFGLFGKTSRVDVIMPASYGRWEGTLQGMQASATRKGLRDPRVRFSINLVGAPALAGSRYVKYRSARKVSTTVGAALAVSVPLGNYFEDKLINLGNNRFSFRPQMGVLHTRGPWSYELTGSVFLFTDNGEFFNGNTLAQDPLYAVQVHLIHTFEPGLWISLSGGYDGGGETQLNGVETNAPRSDVLGAAALGVPIGKTNSLTLTYFTSRTQRDVGGDSESLVLGWSMRF